LQAVDVQPFRKTVAQAKKQGLSNAKKQMVNDAKVSDHHALIPTEQAVSASAMSDKEYKLYQLIVRRFLANFFPASESEQTTVEALKQKQMEKSFVQKASALFLLVGVQKICKKMKETSKTCFQQCRKGMQFQ
jgi:DNA topoisomerase IA